jgi:hypothetical protein
MARRATALLLAVTAVVCVLCGGAHAQQWATGVATFTGKQVDIQPPQQRVLQRSISTQAAACPGTRQPPAHLPAAACGSAWSNQPTAQHRLVVAGRMLTHLGLCAALSCTNKTHPLPNPAGCHERARRRLRLRRAGR